MSLTYLCLCPAEILLYIIKDFPEYVVVLPQVSPILEAILKKHIENLPQETFRIFNMEVMTAIYQKYIDNKKVNENDNKATEECDTKVKNQLKYMRKRENDDSNEAIFNMMNSAASNTQYYHIFTIINNFYYEICPSIPISHKKYFNEIMSEKYRKRILKTIIHNDSKDIFLSIFDENKYYLDLTQFIKIDEIEQRFLPYKNYYKFMGLLELKTTLFWILYQSIKSGRVAIFEEFYQTAIHFNRSFAEFNSFELKIIKLFLSNCYEIEIIKKIKSIILNVSSYCQNIIIKKYVINRKKIKWNNCLITKKDIEIFIDLFETKSLNLQPVISYINFMESIFNKYSLKFKKKDVSIIDIKKFYNDLYELPEFIKIIAFIGFPHTDQNKNLEINEDSFIENFL
jgi:hypothetical protein